MKIEKAKQILKESGMRLIKEDYDTMYIPVSIRKNISKKEFSYRLGLNDEEKKKIDMLFPDFIYEFDRDFDESSGDSNAVEIAVDYRGEPSSWNNGASWGETEVTNYPEPDEVDEIVRETLDVWIENAPDYFAEKANVSEEELPALLDKIYEIIVNRSGEDTVC